MATVFGVRAPAGITSVSPGRGPAPFLRRTRASGAFAPSDIAGLQLWLKADGTLWQDSARTTPATADGDPVGAWDDASGNGRHATQATSGARPLYKTSILNGQPVLRFDGSNDTLALGDISAGFASAATLFTVWTASSSGNYIVYVSNPSADVWWYFSGTAYMGPFRSARVANYPATMPNTGTHLVEAVSSASEYRIYLDGTDQGAQAAAFEAGTDHRIGGVASDPFAQSRWLTGDIAEIIAYNSALDGTNRGLIKTYLNTRYGTSF